MIEFISVYLRVLGLSFLLASTSPVFAEVPEVHGMEICSLLVGEWQYEMHLPEAEQIGPSSRGLTQISFILGGRFLELKSKSTEGPSIEGLMLIGCDDRSDTSEYLLLSLDELSSQYLTARGHYRPKDLAIMFIGKDIDAETGFEYTFETILAFQGRNRFEITYVSKNTDGVATDVARIAYRRINSEAMLDLATSEEILAMSFDDLKAELARVSKLRSRGDLDARDREYVRQVFIDILNRYARSVRLQAREDHDLFMQSQEQAEVIEEIRSLIHQYDGSSRRIRSEMLERLNGLPR